MLGSGATDTEIEVAVAGEAQRRGWSGGDGVIAHPVAGALDGVQFGHEVVVLVVVAVVVVVVPALVWLRVVWVSRLCGVVRRGVAGVVGCGVVVGRGVVRLRVWGRRGLQVCLEGRVRCQGGLGGELGQLWRLGASRCLRMRRRSAVGQG